MIPAQFNELQRQNEHVKITQAQIDILNVLDTNLQYKCEILSTLQNKYFGKMKGSMLGYKRAGVRLAKEEIRRYLKDLQQQLKQLDNE